MNGDANDDNKVDENMKGQIVAKYIRAITQPLLKAHFGELTMDELFLTLENKLVQLIKLNGQLTRPLKQMSELSQSHLHQIMLLGVEIDSFFTLQKESSLRAS
ncbi:hypothetical protein Ahy_B03g068076 [Arachis hypogaea]|uniref:Uncharacterized protein n=1 Tax=Arachis hypogaea TaxID=3818 RepID=A0A445A8J2_ARAHY|nr:hypothetical protein Ahy_B03g068076 [Arachis hypogaea]